MISILNTQQPLAERPTFTANCEAPPPDIDMLTVSDRPICFFAHAPPRMAKDRSCCDLLSLMQQQQTRLLLLMVLIMMSRGSSAVLRSVMTSRTTAVAFQPAGFWRGAPSSRGTRLFSSSGGATGADAASTTVEEPSVSSGERPKAEGITLDAQLISKEPDMVIAHLRSRRGGGVEASVASVTAIGELTGRRSQLIRTRDDALSTRKTLSAEIGKLLRGGGGEEAKAEAETIKAKVEEANQKADAADVELTEVDKEIDGLFLRLPNLLDSRVPEGGDESDNELVSTWGEELVKSGEEYLWHDEIATKVGGWDPEGAVRVSGARFSVLKGPLCRLERALSNFFMDQHTSQNGYTEMSVPFLVTRSTLEGTGQLPKFEDDLFTTNHQVNGEDSFLIPTAEVPLTGLLRGELLDEADLPISMCSLTPCFRAEAGSYGRDTKGLLRQHQFHKVELVKVVAASESGAEHEAMSGHAEGILRALGLPYRKVRLCSGDIGFGARMCYDLEVWMPGQEAYREVSSISNCADFQAKRLGLRYREKPAAPAPAPAATDGGKGKGKGKGGGKPKKVKARTVLCHTLNGSGVAVGRALVAVLENYYNPEDGSVTVPDVLRPYMGGLEKIEAVA